MNIISNTCAGSYLYRFNNEEFKNPFTWNIINYKSLKYLIKNYDRIDFNDIKVYSKCGNSYAAIKINGMVEVNYVHYKNSKIEHKRIGKNDLCLDNFIEYTRECYFKRLKRMKEKPIFVVHAQTKNKMNDFSLEKLRDLNRSTLKYKVIILHNYKHFKSTNKNIISFYLNKDIINIPAASAEYIKNTILNYI